MISPPKLHLGQARRIFIIAFCAAVILGLIIFGIMPFIPHNRMEKYVMRYPVPRQISWSPSPTYGPLALPNGVTTTGAQLAQPNEQTFIGVDNPVQLSYKDRYRKNATKIFNVEEVDITGTVGPAIEKVVVTFQPFFGEEDIYELQKFQPGQKEWKYSAATAFGNLGPGLNIYIIRAYYTFGSRSYYTEQTVELLSGLATSQRVQSDEGELVVEWSSKPIQIQLVEFLKQKNIAEAMHEYINHTSGYMPENGFNSFFQIYRIGKVISGLYNGSRLYLYLEDSCFADGDLCGTHKDVAYILERADGSLVRLAAMSSLVPVFVRFHDEHATLQLSVPATIPVPNSQDILVFHKHGEMARPNPGKTAFTLEDGRAVTIDQYQCLALTGKDGLTRTYNFDFSITDIDSARKPVGKKDGVFAITWLDGKHNTSDYGVISRSCEGITACADPANVHGTELAGVGELVLVGHTNAGDEVFEVAPNERELRTPIPYMERLFPNDNWRMVNFPLQPSDFYAEHPVIFIKDPIGRYQRFLLRKYWAWC